VKVLSWGFEIKVRAYVVTWLRQEKPPKSQEVKRMKEKRWVMYFKIQAIKSEGFSQRTVQNWRATGGQSWRSTTEI